MLCIPIFYENRIDFVEIYPSSSDYPAVPDRHNSVFNYPNPFNANTTIRYSLESDSPVTITVFDLMGRRMETLVDAIKGAGSHSAIWNADGYSSGIYFYIIKAGGNSVSGKMALVK
jgi:hypothetical protein